MRTSSVLVASVVGAAMCCSAATALAGPVQIISQDRRVTAVARPSGGGTPVTETVTAPDNGLFEETATADASGQGFTARATSSVKSSIGNDGIHIEGTLAWETEDNVNPAAVDSATADAIVFHDIFFRLDEAYDFDFKPITSVVDRNGGGGESGEGFTQLTFLSTGVGPGTSGTLQPGDYHFTFQRSKESTVSGPLGTLTEDYTVHLDLSPSDGSSEPNPIPLPPAAWAALSTMGLIGLARTVRRLPKFA